MQTPNRILWNFGVTGMNAADILSQNNNPVTTKVLCQ